MLAILFSKQAMLVNGERCAADHQGCPVRLSASSGSTYCCGATPGIQSFHVMKVDPCRVLYFPELLETDRGCHSHMLSSVLAL